MTETGKFITLEGGEGSGKTTAISFIKELLESKGYEVVVTREPGGVAVSETIRDLILNNEMTSLTEALLFAASRKEHLEHVIVPSLERGAVVICDRFVHSSYAYQGIVGGIGLKEIKLLNEMVVREYMPDLTLFLDVNPEVGLKRIKDNNRTTNKIDNYDLSFHKKIKTAYTQLLLEDHQMYRIDANLPLKDVFEQIKGDIENYLLTLETEN